MPAGFSETKVSEQDRAQFTHNRRPHSEPWSLNNFATVSPGILQTGPWNLAKFSAENCGP